MARRTARINAATGRPDSRLCGCFCFWVPCALPRVCPSRLYRPARVPGAASDSRIITNACSCRGRLQSSTQPGDRMTARLALFILCSYNNSVDITFDPVKSASNEWKHGVPLSHAEQIDWSAVWSKQDIRHNYGELRQVGYGPIGGRLYCVVFTQSRETIRVISLRKANYRESLRYDQATKTDLSDA
jgi:uncharacterized protein